MPITNILVIEEFITKTAGCIRNLPSVHSMSGNEILTPKLLPFDPGTRREPPSISPLKGNEKISIPGPKSGENRISIGDVGRGPGLMEK